MSALVRVGVARWRHEHFGSAIQVNSGFKISQRLRRIRPAERLFSLARQFVSSVAMGERKSPQQAAGSKKFLSGTANFVS